MTTILVIEDDDIVRKLIRKILTQQQYAVLEAAGGHQGVQLALAHQPDLIVCDVMMPGIDGYGVLQKLQAEAATAMIPFVFLTARAEKQDIRQGMRLGADDYLTKPFTKEELLSAIAIRLSKLSSLQQHYSPPDSSPKAAPQTMPPALRNDCGDRFSLQETFEAIALTLQQDDAAFLPLFVVGFERFAQICADLEPQEIDTLNQAIINRLNQGLQGRGRVICLAAGEFCLVLNRAYVQADTGAIAQEILAAFEQFLTTATEEFFLSVSLGIAEYPQDADNLRDLVAQAQAAQRQAQNLGEPRYQFANAMTPQSYPKGLDLADDLRDAYHQHQLTVHYQPQCQLPGKEMVGAEALLRWEHPLRGSILTEEILAIAKPIGLLELLDQFVLTQACRQLRRWANQDHQTFQMAVNLSATQFNQPHFHQDLSHLLIENSLNPANLVLELTESTLLDNAPLTIRRLKAIKTLGVKIVLDDFGLGYSSLTYLKKFPFDFLKLDPSLIRNIHQKSAQQTVVRSLINTAHQQKRLVIAEGVENETELECLQQLNCDRAQGFLLGYPMSVPELEQLLLSKTIFPHDSVIFDAPDP
ncbi:MULTISPECIES: EAL domain-containing protein [Cyanophyceae]|uniref:EAL domain-containing response regulator n=1 Tax=Cyanophyceae TaxID=3028117 RepID=UPI00016DC497|nr:MULTISPECIES: EAL domain-containing protein [Cyanophyceae]ACA98943.1 sensory box protein/response regulator [Picosynechococcus sp. PCC 7002]SMH36658.1 EAL domain, c-di-GMP-specific phosphodiesterase class I (or its enzymatically inactive variant) [Picosynechococcus sp. OG1]SMQ77743.1 EAL domain, c-di-GMP-specific phosphodiesterase class I (or its enzymatically inactive variant) [Synechococcus sp. 7002]